MVRTVANELSVVKQEIEDRGNWMLVAAILLRQAALEVTNEKLKEMLNEHAAKVDQS